MSRWMLGVAGIAVAVMGAWQGDDLAEAIAGLDVRVTAIEERLATRPIGTVEAGSALRFDGEGDVVSEPFPLDQGLLLVTMEAPDDSFGLIVGLVDPETGEEENVVIATPPYSGTRNVRIAEAGERLLSVTSDGAWTVVLEQP